ncbi:MULTISPECIES: FmdB family zinc ribbon protein [Streptomyces]|uniref:FmdB family zinc ribbon protein n=1 Tax=Streptomyces flaveolus TaxID=67297 RepID=A0ABV3AJJ4_9ACTN|nr:zinc ribbon domain-containing protein [Streptomyces sp. MC1]
MATYEYTCSHCGSFDVKLPIGTAPAQWNCPRCQADARRVYSSPAFASTPPAVAALREYSEKSRENPEVVTRAAGNAPQSPAHPALARLPRP